MKRKLENQVYDTALFPTEWRFSAAIVGLIRYFEYHHISYQKDCKWEGWEGIAYNEKDLTEARFLEFAESWYGASFPHKKAEQLLKQGCSRGNTWTEEQIKEILSICEVKPTILQTEVHPYFQERELKDFLQKEGIVIQAWYPLGHGDKALLDEFTFTKLAEKYGKSNAQIILRWHIQAGNVVIPGSKDPAHIRDNFALFDFSLSDEEMADIEAMNQDKRYYTSTPELLKKYVEMVPPVETQKECTISYNPKVKTDEQSETSAEVSFFL